MAEGPGAVESAGPRARARGTRAGCCAAPSGRRRVGRGRRVLPAACFSLPSSPSSAAPAPNASRRSLARSSGVEPGGSKAGGWCACRRPSPHLPSGTAALLRSAAGHLVRASRAMAHGLRHLGHAAPSRPWRPWRCAAPPPCPSRTCAPPSAAPPRCRGRSAASRCPKLQCAVASTLSGSSPAG